MQTQVMFYILPSDDITEDNDKNVSSVIYQACLQASYFYRQKQRVFIYTEDLQQAELVDENLWAFNADSFVPHNLAGEGPKQGAAVEISHNAPKGRRAVLINLSTTVPNFANQFNYIVDFVPHDETLKQLARERFKACRQWGFNVENQKIELPSNTNPSDAS
ncbi:DNA polymerase III subunit chi [Colwellia sp. D2M02]|uniref:DNA polymerase III subunit chi n=1 Tax=Colwellia asteriadis TaxID=517723 RepID=A0ABN1L288_9GAMM|nr:DNA polymerase III subunit chi [Colwellia sp. D2M02]MBU2894058.1 DNA polymerase III subunit chi [Colwellia sp. D2M02]